MTFLDKEYAWRDEAIGTSRLLFGSNFYSQAQNHLKCRCAPAGRSERSSTRDASTHHSVGVEARPARSPVPQQPACISATFPKTDLQDSSDLVFAVFKNKVDACVLVLPSVELERCGDSEAKMPPWVEDLGGRAERVNVGFLQRVGSGSTDKVTDCWPKGR